MTVTRITITTGPKRKIPQAGDRRVTKKHGEQVRIPSMVHNWRGEPIGYDCTGGRQNYEWVSIDKVPDRWRCLLNQKGGAS